MGFEVILTPAYGGKMKRRTIFLGIVLSIVFFGVTQQVSHAAYLKLINQRNYKTPEEPVLQQEPSCVTDYTGYAEVVSLYDLDGRWASAYITGSVGLIYEKCEEVPPRNAWVGAAVTTFTIGADPGESSGDEVTVCYRGSFVGSATATGTAYVESGVGGYFNWEEFWLNGHLVFNPASTITVNDSTVIWSYGPQNIITPPDSSFNYEKPWDTFVAHVGDNITISVATGDNIVTSTGTGSGTGKADAVLQLSIGPCPPVLDLNAYLPDASNPPDRCTRYSNSVATSQINLPGDNNATLYITFADPGTDAERLICDIVNNPNNKSLIAQGNWITYGIGSIPFSSQVWCLGSNLHTYLILIVGNQTSNYTFTGPLSCNHDLTCCREPAPVPGFNFWGMLLFALLLLASAFWLVRRERASEDTANTKE
jgi:hypothetical protein